MSTRRNGHRRLYGECPICLAHAGEPCRGLQGQPMQRAHPERVELDTARTPSHWEVQQQRIRAAAPHLRAHLLDSLGATGVPIERLDTSNRTPAAIRSRARVFRHLRDHHDLSLNKIAQTCGLRSHTSVRAALLRLEASEQCEANGSSTMEGLDV